MAAVRGSDHPRPVPGPEPMIRERARGCRSAAAALQMGAWMLVFVIAL
ncbi:MAG TPA: hypothetical protein VGR92_21100 [Steroidobacteraceae bacterium]|nr:hypothetical protein [Steroidobacteraceae bacterium]